MNIPGGFKNRRSPSIYQAYGSKSAEYSSCASPSCIIVTLLIIDLSRNLSADWTGITVIPQPSVGNPRFDLVKDIPHVPTNLVFYHDGCCTGHPHRNIVLGSFFGMITLIPYPVRWPASPLCPSLLFAYLRLARDLSRGCRSTKVQIYNIKPNEYISYTST